MVEYTALIREHDHGQTLHLMDSTVYAGMVAEDLIDEHQCVGELTIDVPPQGLAGVV